MESGVAGLIDHSATSWFCWSELIFSFFLISVGDTEGQTGPETDRERERERKNGRWWSLLHGLLVLLVCADLLAGLFALLAPLALLVFVPPVAVALLAVVPPPATAANGRRRARVRKGQRRWRGIREVEGRDQRESTGQGGKAIRGREIKKKRSMGERKKRWSEMEKGQKVSERKHCAESEKRRRCWVKDKGRDNRKIEIILIYCYRKTQFVNWTFAEPLAHLVAVKFVNLPDLTQHISSLQWHRQ